MTHSLMATQVEAEALGLVDYHTVITEPMDLGTVDDRAEIFKLCFNSGSLGVCVRVDCIPRRSCPSLGRKQRCRDSETQRRTSS